jgi:hypothetical protein
MKKDSPMEKKKKTNYLSYIEDTQKHRPKLERMAKNAANNAIKAARGKNIAITFTEGTAIITETADGKRTIIGNVPARERKYKKGEKFSLSEG